MDAPTRTSSTAKAAPADGGRTRVGRAARSGPARVTQAVPAEHTTEPATEPARRRVPPRTVALGERVSRLVDTLAPAVGLDPARVRITLVATDHVTSGRASADAIVLTGAVETGDPGTAAVLLHELVHLRQHLNRGLAAPDQTASEAEAAGLALAWREGRPLWVPAQALPDGHLAHDDGATGIAPATEAPPTTPDVASLEKTLDGYVAGNHSGDVKTIDGLLDHPWTQLTSEMIENCLRILTPLRFVIARSLVRALGSESRRKLAQLGDDHHERYPDASVAVLSALSDDDLKDLGAAKVTLNGPAPTIAAAFHGVDPGRLSPAAMRALLATLRRCSVGVLTALEKSDRGDVFRKLFATGPDTGTDERELRTAIEAEKAYQSVRAGGGDDILYDRLGKLLRDASEENARQALTALEPVCALGTAADSPADKPAVAPPKGPPTLDDLRAAVATPSAPGAGSNAPPVPPAPLVALVSRLDADGLIARLVDTLPEDDRRGPTYGPVLKLVLAARSPVSNLARAVELLSYSLFDWVVRDWEARLAYLLVRSTPITGQDGWRALDNGKWLHRLEDNLPDDMWSSGEYTGVGSEYKTPGSEDLGVGTKLLQDYADTLIKRFDDDKTATTARQLVGDLAGIDSDGKPKPWLSGNDAAKDVALRTAIVRRIDARLRLDEIIAKLPDWYLFGEQGRKDLLDLNHLRDPVHLVQQALALAPSGFGWLTFTHRDAWLAVQAIRALSPEAQKQFQTDNGSVWTILWAGLTADMRAGLPGTLASGGDVRLPTADALRDRISDQRLWTEANADQLRALLDLAYAADDKAWVFDKSKELRVDQRAKDNPKLTALVKDLKLYSEADKRTVYVPDLVASSRAPVWGYALGVIGRAIGILAYDLFADDTVSLDVFGKTMHLKGFDLGDIQTIVGDDIEGVKLDRSDKGANRIDVDATFESGFILNIDLKDLEIAGLNIVLPGKSYKSGPISIKGLKATAGFSDRGYHDPAYIALVLDSLALRDLVLADPTLPLSGAWAVARLGLQKTSLRASQDGADDPLGKVGQSLPKGTIPFPIFGPLIQAVKNIVALYGGIPGDYTLLDFAMIPLKIPFPASTAVSFAANKAVPTPAPIDYLWGLASDGVLRPPYSAAQRMKDAAGMLRAYNVSFSALNVEGISIGSGQQIASLALTDVNIGYGQSLAGYLNTTLRTIRDAQAKLDKNSQQYKELDARATALEAQIKNVEATPRLKELRDKRAHDPGKLTEDEKKELAVADTKAEDEGRLRELEGKDRWQPGSLTEQERTQLVELTKKLRSDVGVSLEVGSLTLGPLSGDVQAAGVTLKGIHAQARLPNVGILPYAPGYLDDKSLIEQFKKGGPKVPTIGELAKSSEFSLTIDETTIAQTDPKQPAVILKAGKLPSVVDLQRTIAALPVIEGNKPIRDRLNAALDVLMRLDRARGLAQVGATDKVKSDAAQQVRELTDEAQRLLGIEIGGIKFGRITGDLDPSTGTIKATIHNTEITGLAGPSFAVDKLTGSLEFGVTAGGVSERLDQLKDADKKALAGELKPTLGLSGVTAEGVHLPQGLIKTAKLGRLTGSLQTTEKGYRVPDLHIDFLELDGISLGTPGNGLQGTMARIDELRLDAEVELDPKAKDTQLTRALIHSLRIGAVSGQNLVVDIPQADGRIHAALIDGSIHDVSADEVDLVKGSDGWDVLSGSGAVGSFADVRYSVLLSSLKGGTKSVSGTLTTSKEGLAKQRPTITASYVKSAGNKITLSVADLQAKGTDITTPDGKVNVRLVTLAGTYEASDAGAKASATLTGLEIGTVDWKVGTARLHGTGPLTAKQVTVAAFATPDVPAKDGKPARKGAWSVTDVVITDFRGTDLHYTDAPIDLHLGRDDTPSATGEPPLRVGRVHLQPARGKIEVTDLNADFGGDLSKSLHANAHVGIDSLTVELNRGGHLVAVVKGVSAQASVSGDYTGTVDVKNLQGATIDVGPDGITVGSDDPSDPNGLRIAQVSVSALDITSVAGGHKFHLTTAKAGRIDLLGIQAKVRIDRWKPGEAHKGTSPWKQIAIERLHIDEINFGGVQVDLPDDDITIVIPARAGTDPPTIQGLDLSSPIGTDPAKLHPDFTIDLDTFAIEGKADITSITLPLKARIKDKFDGAVTLSTWTTSVDWFAGGGLRIDLDHPQLTMDKAAALGTNKTLRIGKFGAERLVYTDTDGHVFVKGPRIRDLEYRQTKDGAQIVSITVKSADLDKLDVNTAGGPSLDIGSLDITDAYLELDVAALTAKKPGTVEAPSSFDVTKLRPVVDQINGDVKVVLYVAADVLDWKDIRVGKPGDELVVPIRRGVVDIPTFEKNMVGKVAATDIGENWIYLRPWVVSSVAKDPILRLDGSQLQLGVYAVNPPDVDKGNDPQGQNRPNTLLWFDILTWDLHGVDFDRARADKFSLWSAIFDLHKDKPMSDEDKAKESEKARKKREAKEAEKQRSLDSLEIRSLDADLSLVNDGPLPLAIDSDAAKGTVTLSDKALTSLTFKGGLPAVTPPSQRPGLSENKAALDIGLHGLRVDAVDLTLYDRGDKPAGPGKPPELKGISGLKTGSIRIDELSGASLTFDNLFKPKMFKGRITTAHAENIRWFSY